MLLLPLVAKEKRMKNEEKKYLGGRPKKIVKREKFSGIRFTRSEHFIVKQKALKAGLPLSGYVRQMAIHGNVKTRLNEEERDFVRQLVGMANNLNQVAKSCHEQGALKAMLYFENYRCQVDELLKKLRDG